MAPSLKKNIVRTIERALEFEIGPVLQLALPLLQNPHYLKVPNTVETMGLEPLSEYVLELLKMQSLSLSSKSFAGNRVGVPLALLEELNFYEPEFNFYGPERKDEPRSRTLLNGCPSFMALPRINSIKFSDIAIDEWSRSPNDPPTSKRLKLLKFEGGVMLSRDAAKNLMLETSGRFHIKVEESGLLRTSDTDDDHVYTDKDDMETTEYAWWHMYRLDEDEPIRIAEGEMWKCKSPEWAEANPDEINNAFNEHLEEQGMLQNAVSGRRLQNA